MGRNFKSALAAGFGAVVWGVAPPFGPCGARYGNGERLVVGRYCRMDLGGTRGSHFLGILYERYRGSSALGTLDHNPERILGISCRRGFANINSLGKRSASAGVQLSASGYPRSAIHRHICLFQTGSIERNYVIVIRQFSIGVRGHINYTGKNDERRIQFCLVGCRRQRFVVFVLGF